MHKPQGWSHIVQALSNRHYRTFLMGRSAYHITSWMYRMAVGWIVWDLTHSATLLGFFAFLDHIWALIVMPLAGALSDRMNRLTFMRITQGLLVLQSLILSALIALDLITIEILAVMTVYFGAVSAAQQPANQSLVPSLVPRESLTTAYGLNSLSLNLCRFIGPMLGGVIIANGGIEYAIVGNALGAGVFSICLAVMQANFDAAPMKREKATHMLRDVVEGVRYSARHPGIGRLMILLTILSTVSFPLEQIIPSVADGVYEAGPHGVAWMIGLLAIGAFCQASHLARRGGVEGVTAYVVRAVLILALALGCLAASPWFWMALPCMFFFGLAASSIRVGALTLQQFSVEPEMRGRAASLFGIINHTGPAVGSLLLGAIADLVGMRPTLCAIAVVTLGVWIWAISNRQIMAAALEVEPQARSTDAKP